MEEFHLRHIQNVLVRRERKPSDLHDHIKLIKLAYEGNLGVPTICKILKVAGVTDGTSVPNVQGFIHRQKKLGIIGEKGCHKEAFDRRMKETAKLPSESGIKNQPAPPVQAAFQKAGGGSGATELHSSLAESLSSLSASTGQTSPSDPSAPVAKLKAALKKKKP